MWGPRELFYADLFASRETGCRSQLGLPGARDEHAGCVGAYLVEHDLFDFLLLSLPDNDSHSHRAGPEGQVDSLALADQQLERVVDAGGGLDAFLEDHALIVMADHSHSEISARISLQDGLGDLRVLGPATRDPEEAAGRALPGLALGDGLRARPRAPASGSCAPRNGRARRIPGVDLVMRRAGEEAVVWSERGELRFAPGGDLRDLGGRALERRGRAGGRRRARRGRRRCARDDYPDALARVWSALHCENAGRRPDLGRARLRVHRLGRGRPRRRRQPRLAAPQATRSGR